MPGIDGYEVCRRIRAAERTAYLPVVMITASGSQQRLAALEAGADDFVTKPFDQSELLARVASLARLKRYHDTIERQAAELAAWNAELERRVAEGRSPSSSGPAGSGISCRPSSPTSSLGDEDVAGQSPPRDRRGVLRPPRLHPLRRDQRARGGDGGAGASTTASSAACVHEHEGTLERFTGDGIMVFFNDPVPCDDAAERAVRMALEIDAEVRELAGRWRRLGHDLTPSASGSRRATPRSAGSGSRAASTTPRSAASPTSPPGCAPTPARLAGPGHRPGARRRRTAASRPTSSATSGPRASPGRSGCTPSRALDTRQVTP